MRSLLISFGLREPTPEDEGGWATADPPPWWVRVLVGVVLVCAIGWAIAATTGASFGDTLLGIAKAAIIVVAIRVAVAFVARRA